MSMTIKEIRAYIYTYKYIQRLEENAKKMADFINNNMPKSKDPQETLDYIEKLIADYDINSGMFRSDEEQ